METDIIMGALLIFGLRVLGVTISTVRVLLMTRGRKLATAVLGFFEVLSSRVGRRQQLASHKKSSRHPKELIQNAIGNNTHCLQISNKNNAVK